MCSHICQRSEDRALIEQEAAERKSLEESLRGRFGDLVTVFETQLREVKEGVKQSIEQARQERRALTEERLAAQDTEIKTLKKELRTVRDGAKQQQQAVTDRLAMHADEIKTLRNELRKVIEEAMTSIKDGEQKQQVVTDRLATQTTEIKREVASLRQAMGGDVQLQSSRGDEVRCQRLEPRVLLEKEALERKATEESGHNISWGRADTLENELRTVREVWEYPKGQRANDADDTLSRSSWQSDIPHEGTTGSMPTGMLAASQNNVCTTPQGVGTKGPSEGCKGVTDAEKHDKKASVEADFSQEGTTDSMTTIIFPAWHNSVWTTPRGEGAKGCSEGCEGKAAVKQRERATFAEAELPQEGSNGEANAEYCNGNASVKTATPRDGPPEDVSPKTTPAVEIPQQRKKNMIQGTIARNVCRNDESCPHHNETEDDGQDAGSESAAEGEGSNASAEAGRPKQDDSSKGYPDVTSDDDDIPQEWSPNDVTPGTIGRMRKNNSAASDMDAQVTLEERIAQVLRRFGNTLSDCIEQVIQHLECNSPPRIQWWLFGIFLVLHAADTGAPYTYVLFVWPCYWKGPWQRQLHKWLLWIGRCVCQLYEFGKECWIWRCVCQSYEFGKECRRCLWDPSTRLLSTDDQKQLLRDMFVIPMQSDEDDGEWFRAGEHSLDSKVKIGTSWVSFREAMAAAWQVGSAATVWGLSTQVFATGDSGNPLQTGLESVMYDRMHAAMQLPEGSNKADRDRHLKAKLGMKRVLTALENSVNALARDYGGYGQSNYIIQCTFRDPLCHSTFAFYYKFPVFHCQVGFEPILIFTQIVVLLYSAALSAVLDCATQSMYISSQARLIRHAVHRHARTQITFLLLFSYLGFSFVGNNGLFDNDLIDESRLLFIGMSIQVLLGGFTGT